jgi:hypothetical protein
MKRILLLALVALLAGSAYAETRDVNPTLQTLFDRMGLPFEDTQPGPGVPAIYTPQYIDEGNTDGATVDDTPNMYIGAAIGDLAFIIVESDGTNVPTVDGWAAVPCNAIQDTGTELNIFWQILESTSPTRLVSINGGDHIAQWTFGFKVGTFNPTTPFETDCAKAALGTTDTPVSTAIVTENDYSMVVIAFGSGLDANRTADWMTVTTTIGMNPIDGTSPSVGVANGYGRSTGNGGGSQVNISLQVEAGTTGVVTGSAIESVHTVITFAINGEPSS